MGNFHGDAPSPSFVALKARRRPVSLSERTNNEIPPARKRCTGDFACCVRGRRTNAWGARLARSHKRQSGRSTVTQRWPPVAGDIGHTGRDGPATKRDSRPATAHHAEPAWHCEREQGGPDRPEQSATAHESRAAAERCAEPCRRCEREQGGPDRPKQPQVGSRKRP